MPNASDPVSFFLIAATVPMDEAHTSGDLETAERFRQEDPDLARRSIYAAAVLGEAEAVRRFLTADPSCATVKGGPRAWDPLTYLCFSRYLRLDRSRSPGFVQAARALLDAGGSANTGFYSPDHQPHPEFESVLYGAAGIAHDPELTRLLLERGADPNDGEVTYHAPETWDNRALTALLESGKLSADSLATMLLRKADWHDYEGAKSLLEHGADPNLLTHWGKTALHNALLSDNALEMIQLLLDHGADPGLTGTHPEMYRSAAGATGFSLAARRGRGDVLGLFEQRGIPIKLERVDQLIAACALNRRPLAQSMTREHPAWAEQVRAEGGTLLAQFAGNGNTDGVSLLLDLGVPVDARFERGDGYFQIAQNSTALHVAAWRARHDTVKLLLARSAVVDAQDGNGQTALGLAVRACVDSYWTDRRSPESVAALLEAGASVARARYPSGYDAVDDLLRAHGGGG